MYRWYICWYLRYPPNSNPTISPAAQVWCWEKLFKLPMAKLAWKVYLRRGKLERLEIGDGCCETPMEWTPTFLVDSCKQVHLDITTTRHLPTKGSFG